MFLHRACRYACRRRLVNGAAEMAPSRRAVLSSEPQSRAIGVRSMHTNIICGLNMALSTVNSPMNLTPLSKRWISLSAALNNVEKATEDAAGDGGAKLDPALEEMIREEKVKLDKEEQDRNQEGEKAVQEAEGADQLLEENEHLVGESQQKEFQAETRKILDIVARSLYSDREIFIRELISNASDALEKVRTMIINGEDVCDADLPLHIQIAVDDKKKTFTIQDTGLGMKKEELVQNLGKIGFSGTAEFAKLVEDKEQASNLIGQFGVGFYSAFMAGTKVKVYSKGADEDGDRGWVWESDGSGSYTIGQAEPVQRGTKIIIQLRQDCEEFSVKQTVENIIKTYSNFVGFDISLNGKPVNTVKALWTLAPKSVTKEQHKEFYQFISKAYDAPQYTLHFATDMPLSIRAVFYIPETHMEKYGMGRQELGVSLYSRKILIQNKCKGLLPEWLRFVKGVVDSEDVPLNLSREHLQDSSLIKRLSGVLTRRLLKFLDKEAKADPSRYNKFYGDFSNFLKEGLCTDYVHKEEIARMLRMESSTQPAGSMTTLEEYVGRMPKEQETIWYLIVPNRAYAEESPYYESFKNADVEVLFLYDTRLDDFVMSNLGEFSGKKLKTIESSSAAPENAPDSSSTEEGLDRSQFEEFSKWMKEILVDKITTITSTDRLKTTPCIIVDHENASFRRMMKSVDPKNAPELPKQQLQVNPNHPIIVNIDHLRNSNPELAVEAIEQVFDNALIQAGLIDDSRSMVPRINRLMMKALETATDNNASKSSASSDNNESGEKVEKIDTDPEDDPFVAPNVTVSGILLLLRY